MARTHLSSVNWFLRSNKHFCKNFCIVSPFFICERYKLENSSKVLRFRATAKSCNIKISDLGNDDSEILKLYDQGWIRTGSKLKVNYSIEQSHRRESIVYSCDFKYTFHSPIILDPSNKAYATVMNQVKVKISIWVTQLCKHGERYSWG